MAQAHANVSLLRLPPLDDCIELTADLTLSGWELKVIVDWNGLEFSQSARFPLRLNRASSLEPIRNRKCAWEVD